MSIPEDVRTRRGEPVLVMLDNGAWREGYIEYGETSRCVSIATEPGGARIIVYREEFERRVRPDPGGARPLRDARGIMWPQ